MSKKEEKLLEALDSAWEKLDKATDILTELMNEIADITNKYRKK